MRIMFLLYWICFLFIENCFLIFFLHSKYNVISEWLSLDGVEYTSVRQILYVEGTMYFTLCIQQMWLLSIAFFPLINFCLCEVVHLYKLYVLFSAWSFHGNWKTYLGFDGVTSLISDHEWSRLITNWSRVVVVESVLDKMSGGVCWWTELSGESVLGWFEQAAESGAEQDEPQSMFW